MCFDICRTRKFFTILASVVMYGHALNGYQWAGVSLVFIGLSVEVYDKYMKNMRKAMKKMEHKGE